MGVRLLVAALVFAAAGVRAETRPRYGEAAAGALASAPTTFDPLRGGPGDQEIAALVYDAPFAITDGKPRPRLALALDNPDGATRARLLLRPELHFSDGKPLTARDVAASLARALREPGGFYLGPLKSARAVGDDVVELELARATPELALLLATAAAAVTPRGAAPAGRPIGSGPFVVAGADPGAVQLVANNDYFAGRPYLAAVTLSSFAARRDETASYEVGVLGAARHNVSSADAPLKRRAALVVDGPETLAGYLAVGHIDDAALLRRAVSLAINKERLRRLTVQGPAVAWKSAYDPGRAKSELEARFGSARKRLSLVIDATRFDDRDVAERILADLGRVGIDVTIVALGAAEYGARVAAGSYDLCLGVAAAPDASLVELALLGAVDAASARAELARAAAPPIDFEATRVVPLFRRGARLYVAPELRDLTVDGAGRASWADAHLAR